MGRVRTINAQKKPARSRGGTEPAWKLLPLLLRRGLPEQGEHVLRILVGNLQHGRTGLHQNLSTREVRRFDSEVGIANRALGIAQVNQGVVQGVLIRLERRPLEGAQPTAKRGDLVDRLANDRGGQGCVAAERSVLAVAELEELAAGPAQFRGV